MTAVIKLRIVLLYSILVVRCHGWFLSTTHHQVEIGSTANVTLECTNVDPNFYSDKDFNTFAVVAIKKYPLHSYKYTEPETLISCSNARTPPCQGSPKYNITIDGNVVFDKARDPSSFLRVTWPVADDTTPGRYVCTVNGYYKYAISSESTEKVLIETEKPHITTAWVLNAIAKSKDVIDTEQKSIKDELADLKKLLEDDKNLDAGVHTRMNQSFTRRVNDTEKRFEQLLNKTLEDRVITELSKMAKESKDSHDDLMNAITHAQSKSVSLIQKFKHNMTVELEKRLMKLNTSILDVKTDHEKDIRTLENSIIAKIAKQGDEFTTKLQKATTDINGELSTIRATHQSDIATLKTFAVAQVDNQKQSSENKTKLYVDKAMKDSEEKIMKKVKENENKLDDELVKLRAQDDKTWIALQTEIADRIKNGTMVGAKLNQMSKDLKKFILDSIANLTLKDELNQQIAILQAAITKLDKLELDLFNIEQLNNEREKNFTMRLSKMKNDTDERFVKANKSTNDTLLKNLINLKTALTIKIENMKDNINKTIENHMNDPNNPISNNLQNTTDAAISYLRREILTLLNQTKDTVSHQNLTITDNRQKYNALKNRLALEFVTKFNLTKILSGKGNISLSDIYRKFKNLTSSFEDLQRDTASFTQNITQANLDYFKTKIRETANQCRANFTQLSSRIGGINKYINNQINIKLNTNIFDSMNELIGDVNSLSTNVQKLDQKYSTITDDLWQNTCVCPNASRYTNQSLTTIDNKGLSTTPSTTTTPTTTTTTTTTTQSTTTVKVDQWPKGTYALIMPYKGCPESDGFSWDEGYIKFHTSSEDNNDRVSVNNHFMMPIFRTIGPDRFIQMHYCSKRDGTSTARDWPRGSYCVNRISGSCPSGFSSIYVSYDGEHSHVQHDHDHAPDVMTIDGSVDRVYYCCRKDGLSTTPIYLPDDKPFYLYRSYGTNCQQVWNMNVHAEYVQIDTHHGDNKDELERDINRPDLRIAPVNHTVCYYEPMTSKLP